jgi:hypothetical protein
MADNHKPDFYFRIKFHLIEITCVILLVLTLLSIIWDKAKPLFSH